MLGDLASHGADLARFLLGDITSLTADTAVFVPERARPTGATAGHTRAAGGELGPVENEDYVNCLLRFASGARGVLEACRVSVGEQNDYGFEVHGTEGAVFWDFRRMNELGVSRGTAYQDQPVSTVYVGPGDGEFGAFQPGAANAHGLRRPQGRRGAPLPALGRRGRTARGRRSRTRCTARPCWRRWRAPRRAVPGSR